MANTDLPEAVAPTITRCPLGLIRIRPMRQVSGVGAALQR